VVAADTFRPAAANPHLALHYATRRSLCFPLLWAAGDPTVAAASEVRRTCLLREVDLVAVKVFLRCTALAPLLDVTVVSHSPVDDQGDLAGDPVVAKAFVLVGYHSRHSGRSVVVTVAVVLEDLLILRNRHHFSVRLLGAQGLTLPRTDWAAASAFFPVRTLVYLWIRSC
jgi:hypothetical protein